MLNHLHFAPSSSDQKKRYAPAALCSALVLLTAVGLSACGDKEKKPGQALASVNGEEITVLQLNEELQRAGVQQPQQEAASKQLLESLIDRQLLQNEAVKEKLDRDPKVVQAIERAKALVVAQAYLQKRVGAPAKPTNDEIADYYNKHPELFAQRKQFELRELVFATSDMSDALKSQIDSAKSLDEVAAWMDGHKVKFARAQLSRATTDLPAELSSKLLSMPKGQLFIVREGVRSLLIAIADIKDTPVELAGATPQIGQFLMNKRSKEAADAEVARLRAAAKIEYFNKKEAAPATGAPAASAAPAAAPATDDKAGLPADAAARGAAGLR